MTIIEKAHPEEFLWPEERKLMHQFMRIHQDGFAWSDDERGHFQEDFFPPIEMPTIPHKPWVVKNLPIPPGVRGLPLRLPHIHTSAHPMATRKSPAVLLVE